MKQKLISEIRLPKFDERVNKHLEEGWTVVTGTLVMSAACARAGTSWSHIQAYAVVVQREEDSQLPTNLKETFTDPK